MYFSSISPELAKTRYKTYIRFSVNQDKIKKIRVGEALQPIIKKGPKEQNKDLKKDPIATKNRPKEDPWR